MGPSIHRIVAASKKKETAIIARGQFVKIADLRPYMKNISVHFIVLEKGPVTKTKDDHYVHQYLVADQTGSIWLSLWDEQGLQLMPGDIVQLRSGNSWKLISEI
jgi:ssDNA-binding replication factor A large subunit